MGSYSFLSGSTVDNVSKSVMDMINSGQSYIGFARGTGDYQWGTFALINIQAESYNVAQSKWYVTNEASAVYVTPTNSASSLGFFYDQKNTSNISDTDAYIIAPELSAAMHIRIIEGNESWVLVENISGFEKDYYITLNKALSGDKLYIVKSASGMNPDSYGNRPRLKILKKMEEFTPTYTTNCKLVSVLIADPTSANTTVEITNLQRSITILGETQITGAADFSNYPNLLNKPYMSLRYFQLIADDGQVLVDKMSWVATDSTSTFTTVTSIGETQKFMTFSVFSNSNYMQHLKLSVGSNQINEWAIWNEYLPFDTNLRNSDSNPPALEISYLRTPLIERSIFDYNGAYNIPTSAVKFVKELFSTAEYNIYNNMNTYGISASSITLSGTPIVHYGTTSSSVSSGNVIPFEAHNFVVGDKIFIPRNPQYNQHGDIVTYTVSAIPSSGYGFGGQIVLDQNLMISTPIPQGYTIESSASPINAIINYAYTDNIKTALRYGLNNVMISMSIPLLGAAQGVYEDIYRQLIISYKPSYYNGTTTAYCTEKAYNTSFFNPDTHSTDIGTLLYISNKIPVYRKYILGMTSENFILIL